MLLSLAAFVLAITEFKILPTFLYVLLSFHIFQTTKRESEANSAQEHILGITGG